MTKRTVFAYRCLKTYNMSCWYVL